MFADENEILRLLQQTNLFCLIHLSLNLLAVRQTFIFDARELCESYVRDQLYKYTV